MSRYRMWLLPAAVGIAAALVIGPAAVAGPERAAAGTVVFIHDQEPPSLRPAWVDNSLYATSLVTNNIFLGGQIRDNNANWVTKLFTGAPKLLKKSPLTTQFTFSPKANWSDGKPVTCADWRATWQVWINPANNPASRAGYEDIRSVACKGKTGTVVFKKTYADWDSLLNGGVWPAHVIAGKDANKLFQDSIPVSNGPWKFSSWQKGVQISVVKNPRFTIAPMKLDRVVFRYIADTNARFQALKAGEGQVMEPQPQLQIADFQKDSSFTVKAVAGLSVRAPRHPVRSEGRGTAQGAVCPTGAHHGHQSPADRHGALRDDRSGPADAPEQHLQDLREGLRQALRRIPVQPGEGHQSAQGQRLHRRP